MKHTVLAVLLVGVVASPAFAQGRGRHTQGIPPGHLPPEGSCRVWYDGVPPGHQPPPTSCHEAERIAWRERGARVIYGRGSNRNAPIYRDDRPYPGDSRRGDDRRYPDESRYPDERRYPDDRRYPSTDGRRPNTDGQNRTGRAVPPGEQYPGRDRYPDSRYPQERGYTSDAFRNGYDDGVEKGREDAGDRDRFDPARHSWYRSADRGYNSRFGSREEYRSEYRRGFLEGYESAYDGRQRSGPSWWPF